MPFNLMSTCIMYRNSIHVHVHVHVARKISLNFITYPKQAPTLKASISQPQMLAFTGERLLVTLRYITLIYIILL